MVIIIESQVDYTVVFFLNFNTYLVADPAEMIKCEKNLPVMTTAITGSNRRNNALLLGKDQATSYGKSNSRVFVNRIECSILW